MNSCCRVTLHVAESDGALLHVDSDNAAALFVGGEVYGGHVPAYEGEYTVTPSEQEQTLETSGKRLAQNVIVEPIPSNYGRISYSGSVITVW
jgi:hypothetical protein